MTNGPSKTHTFTVPEGAPPTHNVFLLATPADMYWKLSWEITELGTAMLPDNNRFPRQSPAYHACNCAVTAWHMADWVWQAADAEQRCWLSHKFQFPLVKTRESREPDFTIPLPQFVRNFVSAGKSLTAALPDRSR